MRTINSSKSKDDYIKRVKMIAKSFLGVFVIVLTPFLLNAKNSLEYILKSMVRIQVVTTEELNVEVDGTIQKKFSYGSGFYISKSGLILTAAHVINKASKLCKSPLQGYDFNTNRLSGLTIVFIDYTTDIALLQNEYYTSREHFNKNKFFINLNKKTSSIKKDMTCFCIGFPNEIQKLDGICSLSFGKILSTSKNLPGYKKMMWRKNVLLSSCKVTSGFSGGLVVDSNFLPIGIIIGSHEKKNTSQSIIRKVKDIRKLLDENNISFE